MTQQMADTPQKYQGSIFMASNKSWEKDIKEIMKEFYDELKDDIEGVLNEAATVFKNQLEAASPQSGEMGDTLKNSWKFKDNYPMVRYVGNSKVVSGKDSNTIPLSNLLEYAERSTHKGFRNTFEKSKSLIRNVFVNRLKKGR